MGVLAAAAAAGPAGAARRLVADPSSAAARLRRRGRLLAGGAGRAHVRHRRRHRRPQLLPQGRAGAQAAGRQLRVPLPAADGGDRGQRAAEAAGGRQAGAPPGPAARPADRAAGAGLQVEHRRHARGVEPGAGVAAAGRGRRGGRLRPGGDGERARACWATGVELAGSMLEAVAGADALVIVTEWGEFRSVASPAVRDAMARRSSSTAATCSTRRRRAPPGSCTSRSAAPGAAEVPA